MSRILAVLGATVLSGCSERYSAEPQNARGDTPVRYVICGPEGCFVASRHTNLDSCERERIFGDMICDRKSQPGVITCRTAESMSKTYCLP